MRKIVDSAKKNGISAIIASDQSVIQYAVSVGMPVHMSTQTNITNLSVIKYYAQFADVMVTARELALKQVASLTKAIKREKITGPPENLSDWRFLLMERFVWPSQANVISVLIITMPLLTGVPAISFAAALIK